MQDTPKADLHAAGELRPMEKRADMQTTDDFEINLVELMYRLLEKAKYIVIVSILGAVIAGVITYFVITPKYTATAKLYVMNSGETTINVADFQMGNYLTADYQEIFKNWHVHEMVLQELNLPYNYDQLSDMLEISNPPDTRVLYISVTSENALEAKTIADTYARKAQEFAASTMDTKMPNIFEEALLPSVPSSPHKTMNILLGFLTGVFLACAVIVLNFFVDDRIRSSDEIEKELGLFVLGIMPKMNPGASSGKSSGKSSRKEQ